MSNTCLVPVWQNGIRAPTCGRGLATHQHHLLQCQSCVHSFGGLSILDMWLGDKCNPLLQLVLIAKWLGRARIPDTQWVSLASNVHVPCLKHCASPCGTHKRGNDVPTACHPQRAHNLPVCMMCVDERDETYVGHDKQARVVCCTARTARNTQPHHPISHSTAPR